MCHANPTEQAYVVYVVQTLSRPSMVLIPDTPGKVIKNAGFQALLSEFAQEPGKGPRNMS